MLVIGGRQGSSTGLQSFRARIRRRQKKYCLHFCIHPNSIKLGKYISLGTQILPIAQQTMVASEFSEVLFNGTCYYVCSRAVRRHGSRVKKNGMSNIPCVRVELLKVPFQTFGMPPFRTSNNSGKYKSIITHAVWTMQFFMHAIFSHRLLYNYVNILHCNNSFCL